MFSNKADSNINAAKDSMTSEGAPTIEEAQEKLGRFKNEASHTAGAVKDDLEEVARRTGRHVRDLADSAGHNLGDIGEALAHTMRKKPLKSGAVVLGIGFVLGMLYRR
jgi:ElaB/YqjD/DUF883 family membrane-anchored ribosome-binding protein